MRIRNTLAAIGAVMLTGVILFVPSGIASAHTVEVKGDCVKGLVINATNYQAPDSEDSVNNDAVITIDGKFVNTIPFATGLQVTIPWPTQAASHTWEVVIDANITKGNPTQYDTVRTGSVRGCSVPTTTTVPPTTTTPPTTTPAKVTPPPATAPVTTPPTSAPTTSVPVSVSPTTTPSPVLPVVTQPPTVNPSPTVPSSGSLPQTGSSTGWTIGLAMALLGAGIGVVMITRRKRLV